MHSIGHKIKRVLPGGIAEEMGVDNVINKKMVTAGRISA